MRTSFHHQPEAQHPNFQLFTSWQADYPIFLDAQSPRQVEAFNRWIKEDRAETEALMSAQSQRMEELRKGIQKKK